MMRFIYLPLSRRTRRANQRRQYYKLLCRRQRITIDSCAFVISCVPVYPGALQPCVALQPIFKHLGTRTAAWRQMTDTSAAAAATAAKHPELRGLPPLFKNCPRQRRRQRRPHVLGSTSTLPSQPIASARR